MKNDDSAPASPPERNLHSSCWRVSDAAVATFSGRRGARGARARGAGRSGAGRRVTIGRIVGAHSCGRMVSRCVGVTVFGWGRGMRFAGVAAGMRGDGVGKAEEATAILGAT